MKKLFILFIVLISTLYFAWNSFSGPYYIGGGGGDLSASDINTPAKLETVANLGAYASDILAATNEANFKSIVNLEAGTDFTLLAATHDTAAELDALYLENTQLDDSKGNGDTTFIYSADKVFDLLALKAPINNAVFTGTHEVPEIKGTAKSSPPGSPIVGTEYVADGVNWDPLARIKTDTASTYAFDDDDPDTITSSVGGLLADGFIQGMTLVVTGDSDNNGTYTIVSLTDTVITLIASDSLSDEAEGDSVTLTGYIPYWVVYGPDLSYHGLFDYMANLGVDSIDIDGEIHTTDSVKADKFVEGGIAQYKIGAASGDIQALSDATSVGSDGDPIVLIDLEMRGTTITNLAADGARYFQLPAAAIGLNTIFNIDVAQNIFLKPPSGTKFYYKDYDDTGFTETTSADKDIQCATSVAIGDRLFVQARPVGVGVQYFVWSDTNSCTFEAE